MSRACIYCPNCRQWALALPDGTCAWCSPKIVLNEKRVPDGYCRQCGEPFSTHPMGRGKLYCSKRCHNNHWDQTTRGRETKAAYNQKQRHGR